jgi:hypothetical protein
MESNRRVLAELLNDYIDEELISYQLQKDILFSPQGIDLIFKDFQIDLQGNSYWCQKFFLRRPHFSKFLDTACLIVEDDWSHTNLREKTAKLILFTDDIVEIKFKSKNELCDTKITEKLSILQLRHDPDSAKIVFNNYLQSLPKDFLNKVNLNQEITLNLRVLPGSQKRASQEEKVNLINTRNYISKILSPVQIRDSLRVSGLNVYQKIHRLRLWGIELSEETPFKEVEKHLNQISFSDFNIKNVLHLRVLAKNLSNPNKSNTELLGNSEELQAQALKHEIFQRTIKSGEVLVLPSP